MKKLRLDLDDLAVESFETERTKQERGTVKGYWEYTYYCDTPECTGGAGASCDPTECETCHSCRQTDRYTCVFEICGV